jgi:signal transduction histidine kinase
MLSHWPIKKKLLVGLILLLVIVGTMAFKAFHGVYAYRGLARSVRHRVRELPLASVLAQRINDLRVTASRIRQANEYLLETNAMVAQLNGRESNPFLYDDFRMKYVAVQEALDNYRAQLEINAEMDQSIADNRDEWSTVREMERSLRRIQTLHKQQDFMLETVIVDDLNAESDRLSGLGVELPGFLHHRMMTFAQDVRSRYHTWMVLTWASLLAAVVLLCVFVVLFYAWIFRPLQILIDGSEHIAQGNFDYRIVLDTHDEMSELSGALNDMTTNFQKIRTGLDREVQLRTKQVLRSEQLASVGFLAAGVAHEINNPLASIALCAESLEMRLHDIIQQDDGKPDAEHNQEISVTRNYLRMIQDEAFRCKEITEKLLDFSRKSDSQKHDTDLRELVRGVIDMVGHVGKYKHKTIEFQAEKSVIAPVNVQEFKQVVLNLITNGLESIGSGGKVGVQVTQTEEHALLIVTDDGCGMTDEVLQHLFDPFFTKRRDGKGTGLGLSITFRIVNEHQGHIDPTSDGPQKGSQFCVSLPRRPDKMKEEFKHQYQTA